MMSFTSDCSCFLMLRHISEKRSSTQQYMCICSQGAVVEAAVPQPDPASADTFELQVSQRQIALAPPKQSGKTCLRPQGCQRLAAPFAGCYVWLC